MAQTAEKIEIEEVPSGGIGDFVMSEEDFRVLERQNAAEEYGTEGIARFEDTAVRIAAYGRFGDDQVAHVETGELIVPRQLIDQSPELKNSIFQHLREAGIEDPERYVVGTAKNSINPETGLMEFGFFSDLFKKIKKGFKKIGKALKKVAPIILSVALAGTGLGAIYGAALGSGIGTLIQGGNIKDALKAGLIGGATAGVFKGISSVAKGGTFTGGIGESLANPGARFAQTGSAFSDAFTGIGKEGPGFFKTLGRDFNPNLVPKDDLAKVFIDQGFTGAPTAEALAADAAEQEAAKALAAKKAAEEAAKRKAAEALANQSKGQQITLPEATPDEIINERSFRADDLKAAGLGDGLPIAVDKANVATGLETLTKAPSGSTLENLKEMFDFGLGDSKKGFFEAGKDLFFPTTGDYAKFLPEGVTKATATKLQEEAAKRALADAGLAPGFLRRYGPAAAGLSLAAAPTGFFEAPPQEEAGLLERDEDGKLRTGSDYVDADPFKYRVFPTGFQPTYRPLPNPLVPYQTQMAAEGGEIFPRRTGGIMPDEGIPNEDSVKAMLMPGEFVMTTTAVRGAGDGDLKKGINNMYSVMRNLESRGRAVS
jgi:hypothetical protein